MYLVALKYIDTKQKQNETWYVCQLYILGQFFVLYVHKSIFWPTFICQKEQSEITGFVTVRYYCYKLQQKLNAVMAASSGAFCCKKTRGKSLLESWGTIFLPDWQPPLIFVRFISNFLCMCSNSMASTHVMLK